MGRLQEDLAVDGLVPHPFLVMSLVVLCSDVWRAILVLMM